MADPKKMYRTDGSKVTTPRQPSWKTEIYSLWLALLTDPAILLLFPLFFASVSRPKLVDFKSQRANLSLVELLLFVVWLRLSNVALIFPTDTWQFNDFNGTLFNSKPPLVHYRRTNLMNHRRPAVRTRALNSFCYWTAQIFGMT